MFDDMIIQKDFETIDELLSAYYDQRMIAKDVVGPASMTATNYRNIVYGKKLWLQMNKKPNTYTVIPREAYDGSGYRLSPEFAQSLTYVSGGSGATHNRYYPGFGKVEAGTIGSSKVSPVDILEVSPKTIVNDPYAITMAQQKLAGKDDVVQWESLMELLAAEFPMNLNSQLTIDAKTMDELMTAASVTTNYNLTPIDQIVSSALETSTHSLTDRMTKYANLTRTSTADGYKAQYDSFVSCAAANRELKLSHIDAMFTGVLPYWNDYGTENKVLLTNFDTIERMQTLAQSQQRFMGWVNHQVSYNGVKSIPGEAIGFGVSQYRGIPVVADQFIWRDGLGRIYLLDTSVLKQAVLVPPQYIEDKNFLSRSNLNTLATYYSLGEVVCTKPRNLAKGRDFL